MYRYRLNLVMLLLATLSLVIPACISTQTIEPVVIQGSVLAKAASPNLQITNNTNVTIYYNIFPADIVPTISWMPSADPDNPKRVFPGQTVSVPYKDFFFLDSHEEAIVY